MTIATLPLSILAHMLPYGLDKVDAGAAAAAAAHVASVAARLCRSLMMCTNYLGPNQTSSSPPAPSSCMRLQKHVCEHIQMRNLRLVRNVSQ